MATSGHLTPGPSACLGAANRLQTTEKSAHTPDAHSQEPTDRLSGAGRKRCEPRAPLLPHPKPTCFFQLLAAQLTLSRCHMHLQTCCASNGIGLAPVSLSPNAHPIGARFHLWEPEYGAQRRPPGCSQTLWVPHCQPTPQHTQTLPGTFAPVLVALVCDTRCLCMSPCEPRFM